MRSLGRLGRAVGGTLFEGVGRVVGRFHETAPLRADLLASDDAYLIVFDAPGASTSDVQVRYRDGAVQVRIDRFRDHHEGFELRFPGRGLSLNGRMVLPDDANVSPEDATATLSGDGTLSVRVPRRAGAGRASGRHQDTSGTQAG